VRKVLFMLLVLVVVVSAYQFSFAQEKDFPKDKIISIATEELQGRGIKVEAVNIVYDEGGKLWSETFGEAAVEDKSPNHGILKQGFLKNYRIVFFDFQEPLKDIWVFVDKDSGEVLTVHQE